MSMLVGCVGFMRNATMFQPSCEPATVVSTAVVKTGTSPQTPSATRVCIDWSPAGCCFSTCDWYIDPPLWAAGGGRRFDETEPLIITPSIGRESTGRDAGMADDDGGSAGTGFGVAIGSVAAG